MTRPTSASCNDRPTAFDSTRPMPATLIEHPAAHIYNSTIPAIDIAHLAEDPNTTAMDFTYTFVNLTINYHFCCIYYLAFVPFIVFGCHYSHALNLKRLQGRHAYRLHNRPESDWNEEVLCIPQNSIITGTSPLDCSVSCSGHSLGGSYPSTEKLSVFYNPSRLGKPCFLYSF